ncbi:MAG: hypothetical protein NTU76_02600 [Candidatus Taylorbacteria bacterium]|nr:hypothetical protein [Candidatus Taylorbacteria bacterium]
MKKTLGNELSLSRERSIKSYCESSVVSFVKILATIDSCEACKKWQGKNISLQDVRLLKILPIKDCSHKKGCRCCYIPIVEK